MSQRRFSTVNDVRRLEAIPPGPGRDTVLTAWERFVQGEDYVRGVRPEVAISWHRCRERYRVDPRLREAPGAIAESDHSIQHDMVFAELGGFAASLAREVDCLRAVVTVTDATGRILARWGDPATVARAQETNLAPWSCWSEPAAGTNGMGTALEMRGPTLVRGPEHWCQAFHSWVCAGIAVRDVVTGEPIAVLNVSAWRAPLPENTGTWLARAVTQTQRGLRRRARETGAELAAVFADARSRSRAALAAVDRSGKVIIADDRASMLMGVPALTPAVDPVVRWVSGLPELVAVARYASKHAAHDPDWVGSAEIFTRFGDEPVPISIHPVFLSGHLAGNLISFEDLDGVRVPEQRRAESGRGRPRRVVAMCDDRMVLLRLPEVSYAESDGNDVWLETERGRMRSASSGLDKLDGELADAGFLRVHRRYLVNLAGVQEVERGAKGELALVMEGRARRAVPVSRRCAPAVRRALGI
jgi:hypothetical protein